MAIANPAAKMKEKKGSGNARCSLL
uniref:Uncharacterized protein n=1 Tax=Anguilla anguilla TaxID=7936 RepID=A0A0E9VNF3_ANGAN